MESASSIISRIVCVLLSLALVSCGGGSSLPSPGSGSGSIGSETAGETVSDFFVAVGNSGELNPHVRTVGSFSTKCTIPSSTTAINDIQCIIDVPEGNLNFYGIEFNYNVPSGMCRYLRRTTYWYYNQEIGVGPTQVYLEKSINADGVTTGYRCGENGGALGSCNSLLEYNVNTEDNTVTCVYDKSSAGFGNCCLGSYRYILETINTATATSAISTSDREWGGDVGSCIGGAGKTDWSVYTKSGYPARTVEYAANGLSGSYEVTAPIRSTNDRWNIPVANFYTPALHTHDGYVSATSSTLPYFVEPIDDRNGSLILTSGNVPYTWECLDENYDIKHRLRVFVREWDLYADYLAYIASSGATVMPDRPGDQEGVDCDGIQPDPCNDRWDLDDYINELLLVPYETATPALRGLNFPSQEY